MKKLLIAACAVALATVVEAASATWNSGTLYYAAGADGGIGTTKITTANTVQGYYFNVSEALYTAITASFSQEDVFKAFTADGASSTLKYGDFAAVTVNKTGSNLATGTLALKDTNSYSSGDTVYGVLIYTYTDATYGDMYVANAGEMTFASSSNKSLNNMANTFGGNATAANNNSWQSVPEPTSGLLLLLGMAGLALKRKVA